MSAAESAIEIFDPAGARHVVRGFAAYTAKLAELRARFGEDAEFKLRGLLLDPAADMARRAGAAA